MCFHNLYSSGLHQTHIVCNWGCATKYLQSLFASWSKVLYAFYFYNILIMYVCMQFGVSDVTTFRICY